MKLLGVIALLIHISYSVTWNEITVVDTLRETDLNQCWVRRKSNQNQNMCDRPRQDDFVRQNVDLTWDEIVDACPGLLQTSCTKLSDLVWPVWKADSLSRYQCECPQCKCAASAIRTEYSIQQSFYSAGADEFDVFPKFECVRCSCTYSSTFGTEIQTCTTINSDWAYVNKNDEFVCPVTTEPTASPTTPIGVKGCMVHGHEYNVGEGYFSNTTGDASCKTYCVCQKGGNSTCRTGWANIYANELTYYTFLDQCKDYVTQCHTTARIGDLFDWNIASDFCHYPANTGSGGCPRCGCNNPHNAVNTTTVASVVINKQNISNSYINYECSTCNCTNVNIKANLSRSAWYPNYRCTDYRSPVPNPGSPWTYRDINECNQPNYRCMTGTASAISYYPNTYSNPGCRASNGYRYCSSEGIDYANAPSKICQSPETIGTYGCEKDYVCDAFNEMGPKSSASKICYDTNVTYNAATYDCNKDTWVDDTVVVRVRFECCKGEFCNNRTISSMVGCQTKSDNLAFQNYFKGKLEYDYGKPFDYYNGELAQFRYCPQTGYASRKYRTYWNKLSGSNSRVCQFLSYRYQKDVGSECARLEGLINALKTITGTENLVSNIERTLNVTLQAEFPKYDRYMDYYGCTFQPLCNPGNAGGTDAAQMVVISSVYFIAIAIISFIMF